MKKITGSILFLFIVSLLLAVAPPGFAGGRSYAYAGGKNGGGYHGYRGGHGRQGHYGYKRTHGRWGHYRHGWGPRWGVHFRWNGPVWWGPWPVPFGFSAPPPVIVQQQPPVFVQPEQEAANFWYYCQEPQGYYPYIKNCPGGWMRVVPETTPPNP